MGRVNRACFQMAITCESVRFLSFLIRYVKSSTLSNEWGLPSGAKFLADRFPASYDFFGPDTLWSMGKTVSIFRPAYPDVINLIC